MPIFPVVLQKCLFYVLFLVQEGSCVAFGYAFLASFNLEQSCFVCACVTLALKSPGRPCRMDSDFV